ncbi:MAG: hypothetical protein ACKV19_19630 [Verrucomicrobiales bacterium]
MSVPESMAGVAGPCPCCGGWLVSPVDGDRLAEKQPLGFISRRELVPPVTLELTLMRPESRVDWRERRRRSDEVVSWFQRSQARLSVMALVVTAAVLAFLYGHGWNLPWNMPEDSAVIRFFEAFTAEEAKESELPAGPEP